MQSYHYCYYKSLLFTFKRVELNVEMRLVLFIVYTDVESVIDNEKDDQIVSEVVMSIVWCFRINVEGNCWAQH